MTKRILVAFALAVLYSHATLAVSPRAEIEACKRVVDEGFRPIAVDRADRFLGKVQKDTALCRGGERALKYVDTPWVDWSSYWATGDAKTLAQGHEAATPFGRHVLPNGRGVDGSLIDLEYQRIELIKFNLFDNYYWVRCRVAYRHRSWAATRCRSFARRS